MGYRRKHKFQAITKSPKAQRFQEELLDEIRQQRKQYSTTLAKYKNPMPVRE